VRTNFCDTGLLPLDTTYRRDFRVEREHLERIGNQIFTGVQNALHLRHAVLLLAPSLIYKCPGWLIGAGTGLR
jgi:hypothetical protein